MSRRNFIKKTGLAAVGIGIAGSGFVLNRTFSRMEKKTNSSILKDAKHWENWSGNQTCTPKEFFMPSTEEEIILKLKNSNDKFRLVGGGHSFSPVVPTPDILTSLNKLSGIISHNPITKTARIHAGTHLYDLTKDLLAKGYSFANQGDIDKQSLGGAVSTSTHGTGQSLQSFAGMCNGFRLITAHGEVVECNATNNTELYYGGTVALGALGFVTQYDMQLMPKYKLEEHSYTAKVDDMLDGFMDLTKSNRHFEIWNFIHSDVCLVKTLNTTDKEVFEPEKPFLSDDFLLAISLTLTNENPESIKKVMKIMSGQINEVKRVNWAQNIFPSERSVAFNEQEYEIPIEKGIECLRELVAYGKKNNLGLFAPFEVRSVKKDDFWLSPFYQRDSIAISAHQFKGYEYDKYFMAFHQIMKKYEARPHWGKLQYFTKNEIKALYPKYDDFVKLKKEFDPKGRFSNDYISKIFS